MKKCDHCGKRFLPFHNHYAYVKNGRGVVIHDHCRQKLFENHLEKKNGFHLE
jgi:hypothetical protein